MNRQRGMSSLAMVLLLLLLGSLMLNGLNQQLTSHIWRVSRESKALRQLAEIHSAMEWARTQQWESQPALQCLAPDGQRWRACLRIFADNAALLVVASEDAQLWRLGEVHQQRVTFSPRGWSDFCPRKESEQCLLP